MHKSAQSLQSHHKTLEIISEKLKFKLNATLTMPFFWLTSFFVFYKCNLNSKQPITLRQKKMKLVK